MSADLPQLRVLRYAPPLLTMLSYPFLFLPSRFPSVIYPGSPRNPPSSSQLISLRYRSVFRVYLSSSSPSSSSFLFSLSFKTRFHPFRTSLLSLSSPFLPLDPTTIRGHGSRKRDAKRFPPNGPCSSGYFKQLLSAVPATTKTRLHTPVSNTHDSVTVCTVPTGGSFLTLFLAPARLTPSLPVCLLVVVYRAFWQLTLTFKFGTTSRPINQRA